MNAFFVAYTSWTATQDELGTALLHGSADEVAFWQAAARDAFYYALRCEQEAQP